VHYYAAAASAFHEIFYHKLPENFSWNYSGKVPLFFRKFPEKFHRKFPEFSELTTLSALTAETISEIIKCMSDVDVHGHVRMGSKSEIFRFFNSGYAHDRNISIFRRRASRVTENTLIEPNYASVRQLRDSLHRDMHKLTKKVVAAPCSETA